MLQEPKEIVFQVSDETSHIMQDVSDQLVDEYSARFDDISATLAENYAKVSSELSALAKTIDEQICENNKYRESCDAKYEQLITTVNIMQQMLKDFSQSLFNTKSEINENAKRSIF